MTLWMEFQLKKKIIDPADPHPFIIFLSALKNTWNENWIKWGAFISHFQFFAKKTTKAAISASTTTVDKKRLENYVQVTQYYMVSKYLLHTYATDDIISENDAQINRSKQGDHMSPQEQ